jgi:hypothetical protein
MKITIIKPKTRITMKPNNFTFYILFAAGESATGGPASGEPGKALKCGLNLFIPNEPNFQTSGLTVTLDMIRTYNEN